MSDRRRFVGKKKSTGGMAAQLLAAVDNGSGGFAIDGLDLSIAIKDPNNPANNFLGNVNNKLSYSGSSTKYVRNSAGIWTPNNSLCTAYGAGGTPFGIFSEEPRVNGIRNPTAAGAAPGTPGTAPTNWDVSANANGLTVRNVGSGTQNGINYIDYRFFGTTTNANGITIKFDTSTAITATTGQTWTKSAFAALIAGSITNLGNITLRIDECTAAGAFLAVRAGSSIRDALTASLVRFEAALTTANASTGRVQPYIQIDTLGSGRAIDITIRIGWPQLELGAFATSPMVGNNAAFSRNGDSIQLPVSAIPYNALAGTMFVEYFMETRGVAGLFSISDSGTVYKDLKATATQDQWVLTNGGSDTPFIANAATGVSKVAGRYGGGQSAAMVSNGNYAAGTSNVTSFQAGGIPIRIGRAVSTSYANCYIRRCLYVPYSMSQAQMQAIPSIS